MPVQCEYYALEGLSDLLSTIRIVKRSLNPEIALEGVVLTMYDGAPPVHAGGGGGQTPFPRPGCTPPSFPQRSAERGPQPRKSRVCAYDALSRGAEAYDQLARELVEHNRYAVTRV